MFLRDRAELEARLRVSLIARLGDARERTDSLFALLHEEALRERPVPERHRLVFYLGHLEAFDANLIVRDSLGRESRRPELDRLFAFGIDPLGEGLPQDAASDWPSTADVRRYAAAQRAAVDDALESTPLLEPVHPNLQNGWAVKLAIETLSAFSTRMVSRKPAPTTVVVAAASPVRLRFERCTSTFST